MVWDYFSQQEKARIALRIQKQYPGIEQVMFIEYNAFSGKYRGIMASGEFCANALRALGYLLLQGKDGTIELETSGTQNTVHVTIKKHFVETTIPILNNLNSIEKWTKYNGFIVKMDNEAFLIASIKEKQFNDLLAISKDEQIKLVYNFLNDENLTKNSLAGLLLFDQTVNEIQLYPFIYIKNLNTLYYETACGSGSAVLGAVLAKIYGQNFYQKEIIQPNGKKLHLTIEMTKENITSAKVGGNIEILYDGKITLPTV